MKGGEDMAERRKAELPFVMLPMTMLVGMFKPREIALYACLLKHCGQDNTCWPSRKTLAKECCISTKSVDTGLSNLEKFGLIKRVPRYLDDGRRTSNYYIVYDQLHVVDEDSA